LKTFLSRQECPLGVDCKKFGCPDKHFRRDTTGTIPYYCEKHEHNYFSKCIHCNMEYWENFDEMFVVRNRKGLEKNERK
jgi:hypothetical protein